MRLNLASGIAVAALLTMTACDELRTGVEPLPIGASIHVVPGVDTIFVADTVTAADSARFRAYIVSFAGDSTLAGRVRWSSSDPAVATVDQSGLVTATGIGEALIIADAGERARARIVVLAAVRSLLVTPTLDTLLEGDSTRLVARALDQNGRVVTGVRYTWTSSNPAAATVDSLGTVRALQAGRTRITVRAAGLQAASDIEVLAPPIPLPPFP